MTCRKSLNMIFLDLFQQSKVPRRRTDLQQRSEPLVASKHHQQQQQQQTEPKFRMNRSSVIIEANTTGRTEVLQELQHHHHPNTNRQLPTVTSTNQQPATSNHYNSNSNHYNSNPAHETSMSFSLVLHPNLAPSST